MSKLFYIFNSETRANEAYNKHYGFTLIKKWYTLSLAKVFKNI